MQSIQCDDASGRSRTVAGKPLVTMNKKSKNSSITNPLFSLPALFCALWLPAQNVYAVEDDYALWLLASTSGDLGDQEQSSWRYMFHGEYRLFNALEGTRQVVGRTGIGYQLSRGFSIWLRYDFHYTNSRERGALRENRLQQVVDWAGDGPGITTIKMRGIIEERWLEGRDGTGLRLRLQARVEWPMQGRSGTNWVVWVEPFYDLRTLNWVNNGWNQNRTFLGASLPLCSGDQLELGYMNQWGNPFGDRDIMSHTLLAQYRFR